MKYIQNTLLQRKGIIRNNVGGMLEARSRQSALSLGTTHGGFKSS